jgi:hypothetical protein
VKEREEREMQMEKGGVESIYRRFKLYDFIGQKNKERERSVPVQCKLTSF